MIFVGEGYKLVCEKCGYSVNVYHGIGFRHFSIEEEKYDEIKSGKHGQELQNFLNNNSTAGVHISYGIYLCEKCGEIKSDLKIDLCVLKPEFLNLLKEDEKQRISSKSIEDTEIGLIYDIAMTKKQYCDKCNSIMNLVVKPNQLCCPECNIKLRTGERFCWD